MTRATITIAAGNQYSNPDHAKTETVEAELITNGMLGLAVHRVYNPTGHELYRWVVTHVPTGLQVSAFRLKRQAREYAVRIGDLPVPWATIHNRTDALAVDMDLRNQIAAIRQEYKP